MPRLLVLCQHPDHLPHEEAEAWLGQEVESVLGNEELREARLTRLGPASPQGASSFDWLVEFPLEAGSDSAALQRGGALSDLIGDLRLLGMAPAVLLADDDSALELQWP